MCVLVYLLLSLKCYSIADELHVILDVDTNCKAKQDNLIVYMNYTYMHFAPDGLTQYVDADLHLLRNLSKRSVLHVILDVYSNCKEKQDNVMVYVNNSHMHFAPDGLTQYINADLQILNNLPKHTMVELSIERCKSKESPDTCMHFTKLKSSKYCNLAMLDVYGLKKYLRCFSPQIECPLQKIVYRIRNCVLDLNNFRMFPITSGVYWKITAQIYHGTSKIGCGYASGIVVKK